MPLPVPQRFSAKSLPGLSFSSFGGSGTGMGQGYGQWFGQGFGQALGMAGSSVSASVRRVGGAVGGFGGSSAVAGLRSGGQSFCESVSVIVNDKQQLQLLNDRLAAYIEKVKRLETTNRELNEKLRVFAMGRAQSVDLENFEQQLTPLHEKLQVLIKEYTRVSLAIDNAKLAADDFRMKLEAELSVRLSVEADLVRLKALKKEYENRSSGLLLELQSLSEEGSDLRDVHREEMTSLRGQIAGTLTVDVMEVASTDLSTVLAEIRSEYEAAIEKNRREAETWYTTQVEKKQAEVAQITESTVSGSSEIVENQKRSQTLQTQMDTVMLEKVNAEQRLVEVQAQFHGQMASLGQLAAGLEAELLLVRDGALQQSHDYQTLLSTKVQLEREIGTYKALLEKAGETGDISLIQSDADIASGSGGTNITISQSGGVTVSSSSSASLIQTTT